jgi:hypothetical protein
MFAATTPDEVIGGRKSTIDRERRSLAQKSIRDNASQLMEESIITTASQAAS